MTEPTDAELDAAMYKHWPAFSMQATLVRMRVRAAMRAALAKWGTPQPVVRESSEDLYWELHGLSKILEGSGLIDESRNPDAYTTILDAMAFVRWAQPVVRGPLTCEWTHNDDDGYWDTSCGKAWRFDDGGPKENNMNFCHCCGKTLRIKGGQYGTDN